MSQESVKMVRECVSSYAVEKQVDGSVSIRIDVPQRFADLWLVKLSELETDTKEIEAYESTAE